MGKQRSITFLASGGKYGSSHSSLPSIGVGFNSVSGCLFGADKLLDISAGFPIEAR
jgi:hypothetical protein